MSQDQWEALKSALPYLSTLLLSCWGGLVGHLQKLRASSCPFSWRELFYDLIISSFTGFVTHYLCVYSNVDGAMASVLIAISAHMGARALAKYEQIRDKWLGIEEKDSNGSL